AGECEAQRLGMGQASVANSPGDPARVRAVDPVHIGVDLAPLRTEREGEGDGRRIAAAPAERRDLAVVAQPLEPGDDRDPSLLERPTHAPGADGEDPRGAVRVVRPDLGLRAGQRDGGHAELLEREGEERGRGLLAGREDQVELAAPSSRRARRDGRGEGEERVRRVAHRGGDDDDPFALPGPGRDAARHVPDPVRRPDGGAAVLLDDQRHASTSSSPAPASSARVATSSVPASTSSTRTPSRSGVAAKAVTPSAPASRRNASAMAAATRSAVSGEQTAIRPDPLPEIVAAHAPAALASSIAAAAPGSSGSRYGMWSSSSHPSARSDGSPVANPWSSAASRPSERVAAPCATRSGSAALASGVETSTPGAANANPILGSRGSRNATVRAPATAATSPPWIAGEALSGCRSRAVAACSHSSRRGPRPRVASASTS